MQTMDSVDALLASWHERRPELDFSPVAVISRLGRVRGYIAAELDRVYAAHGLGAATFGVLVTLARIGDEQGVSQRRLMDELQLTSGTISVRIDRLVEEGLVIRRPDPESKRNALITLTPHGRELFERVVPAHLANERRLLAALSDDERETLAGLLRKLLVEFEGSSAPGRLGVTLAPAHVTIALREAVGLPPIAGLLVRTVEDGPLRPGDVLVRANGRELRSIADLRAAFGDSMRLEIVRGVEALDLELTPGPPRDPAPVRRGEHAV